MKDLIKVLRFKFAKDWTISKYLVDNVLFGFGVEDELRTVKVKGETAIGAGRYVLGLRQSPRFSNSYYWSDSLKKLISKKDFDLLKQKGDYRTHDLIWITGVTTHEFVLIHWGNTDDDTDGCYIVGSAIGIVNGQEGVTGSRANYVKLYQRVYPLIKANPKEYSIVFENEK
jgi:hypothetical protein